MALKEYNSDRRAAKYLKGEREILEKLQRYRSSGEEDGTKGAPVEDVVDVEKAKRPST